MKEENIKVYTAFDGTKFFDEKECRGYEKKENGAKYYEILYSPDLTETGLFTSKEYVKVYEAIGLPAEDVILDYCFRKYGTLIGESVMGYGQQRHWSCLSISLERFNNKTHIIWGGRPLPYDVTVIENYDHKKPLDIYETKTIK